MMRDGSADSPVKTEESKKLSLDLQKSPFKEFKELQFRSFSVCNFWNLQLMPDYARINA